MSAIKKQNKKTNKQKTKKQNKLLSMYRKHVLAAVVAWLFESERLPKLSRLRNLRSSRNGRQGCTELQFELQYSEDVYEC